MRNVPSLLLTILVLSLSALAQDKPGVQVSVGGQGSHKSYTLPSGVTLTPEARNVQRGGSGDFLLQESGTVPPEAKYCCSVPCGEDEGGSLAVQLEHYSLKEEFDKRMYGLKFLGGLKALVEPGYQGIEICGPDSPLGCVQKKGPLSFEDFDGGQASFYETTVACAALVGVEMKVAHETTTVSDYHVQWGQNNNVLDLTIALKVSNAHDRARKYAHEVIEKVKNLDYSQIK